MSSDVDYGICADNREVAPTGGLPVHLDTLTECFHSSVTWFDKNGVQVYGEHHV